MPIDFSPVDQYIPTAPAPNQDVAYLRGHAKQFIRAVDTLERLHTKIVVPLPFDTWNAVFVLQPAGVVLKLSPWSDQEVS